VHPVFYIGGVVGAIYVLSVIWLIPKLGASSVMLGLFAGQIFASLAVDIFGVVLM
jgi:transporter family-2 protein